MTAVVDQDVSVLEAIITALDTAFEAGDDCVHPLTGKIVSDAEYDLLRKQLEKLNPTSDILKSVTASKLVVSSKRVTHNPPMTSISKASGTLEERTKSLENFLEKVKAELNYPDPEKELVQAYKHDGVAVALYYENGKLVRAGLRPRDGVSGDDVTENIKFVEGVAQELWEHDRDGKRVRFLPVTCTIRGELECKKSVFRKVQAGWQESKYGLDSEPKNPRNYTAGSIRQFTDPTVTKHRMLSFIGYSIYGWTSQDNDVATAPFKTEIERAKYCNAKLRIPYVQVRPFRNQDLKNLEDFSKNLDFEVDGIVLSVNNLEDAEQMGTHGDSPTGNPKGKLAWKFAEESQLVEVTDIVWTPGRTGKLTPVMKFDGVLMDGTTVSQCTGHSLGFMDGTSKASLGEIGRWTKIRIIKSGKIIPKVVEVVKKGYNNFIPPYNCPCCNSKLLVRQGDEGSDLICPNEFCGERATARIVHYLSTLGVKGIGSSIVDKLIKAKLVENFADLYDLTVKNLTGVRGGFSERQALLIIAQIWLCDDPNHKTDEELAEFCNEVGEEKLKVPAAKLFAALGIPGAGKTAGQDLVANFGTFEAIQECTVDDLLTVDGMGKVGAEATAAFFTKYDDVISRLLDFIAPEGKKTGKLSGNTFVFSGGFDGGKQFWQDKVLNLGATVSDTVSANTNYLVVGTDAGSKVTKATKLGVKMITPTELDKMIA